MIRDILIYKDNKDVLTQKSEEITDINEEIKILANDLIETLNVYVGGVGISAIQVGVPKRICVIKYNRQNYVLINPVITRTRGTIDFQEGCLSVPDTETTVTRAKKIWCTYTDLEGNTKEIADGGLCSIIIQHELDHFEGKCPLFTAYEEAHQNEQN